MKTNTYQYIKACTRIPEETVLHEYQVSQYTRIHLVKIWLKTFLAQIIRSYKREPIILLSQTNTYQHIKICTRIPEETILHKYHDHLYAREYLKITVNA